MKVAPSPGSLATQIRPPISRTSVDEIVRPRPVPPNRRVVDPSACMNGSKMVPCLSGAIPIPVSVTSKCSMVDLSVRECSPTVTSTCPLDVNLIALPTRFDSTWRTRTGSPTIPSGTSDWISHISSSPFSSAFTASGFSVCCTSSRTENEIASSSSLRDSILEKSRMSLRIESSESADDLTVIR